ncbi:MAG TPA: MFS transporter [Acidimicrobiales bacterium]|nr:MFS transporter [Acidimicrobiales bacterium]
MTDVAAETLPADVPRVESGLGADPAFKRWDPRRITHPAPLAPLVVLIGLAGMVQFELSAFNVLGPEIKSSLHLSYTAFTAVVAVAAPFFLLLDIPVGYYGDRVRRMRIASLGLLIFAAFSALTGVAGLAGSVALLVVARIGVGTGGAFTSTQNSLIADYYPLEVRARVYYAHRAGVVALMALGPALVGVLVLFLPWQIPFLVIAVPSLFFVAGGLRLWEPVRGLHERRAMGADDVTAAIEEEPVSFSQTFRTLWNTRAAKRIYLSLPFLAGGFIGITSLTSLLYQRQFHVSAAGRGFLQALVQPGELAGLVVAFFLVQRVVARDPGRSMVYIGLSGAGAAVCLAGFALAPTLWVAFAFQFLYAAVLSSLIPGIFSVISLAVPPHMRTLGFASGSLWILLGVPVLPIAGAVADKAGIRMGLLVFVPVFMIGALILASAGPHLNREIERLRAYTLTRAEALRARAEGRAKLLMVRGVDAGYDGVQVLFGVDLDVADGELVALLGTNGSGKSTLLKAISGLLTPTAGAILFDGRDITTPEPRQVVALGLSHMPGGRGVFPTLTVAENLKVAAWMYRRDTAYLKEATDKVLGYFPVLRQRWNTAAGSLSGGEQQMLSLAQAFLSRPRLLMIDELSLGLAPTVVERLLEIVRAIHANGTTVILVEQSVNIALQLAERAVFLEKGEVRFTGPTAELLARDEILRAVYLHGTAAGLGDGETNGSKPAGRRARRARPSGPVVLSTRGLTKRYGGVTAVRDVALELREGEILGLIGPNGAGKTTLFEMISGHVANDGGRVELLGHDVTDRPAHLRARAGLGRSFQDARLWPGLTVAETVSVAIGERVNAPGALHAVFGLADVKDAEADMGSEVADIISLLNLGAFRDKFTAELSTGSRRLVELAVMVAARPKVLLLDEPSAGIAQREAEALGPVLRRVQEHLSCSILIIEHDMPLMRSLADRLVAMDTGSVIAEGPPDAVLADPQVVASYLGSNVAAIERSGNGAAKARRPTTRRPATKRAAATRSGRTSTR